MLSMHLDVGFDRIESSGICMQGAALPTVPAQPGPVGRVEGSLGRGRWAERGGSDGESARGGGEAGSPVWLGPCPAVPMWAGPVPSLSVSQLWGGDQTLFLLRFSCG